MTIHPLHRWVNCVLPFVCVFSYFAILGMPSVQADYDDDTSLDYTWTPATGPVDHYEVLLSVDGSGFTVVGQSSTPSFTYTGAEDGRTYQLKVRAVDAAGNVGPESLPSDPTTVLLPFEIHLAEGWNLISFPIAECYYQGTQPTVPMPNGTTFVNVADLGYANMAEWFSAHLTPNNPISGSAWFQVKGFDQLGAHVMDSTVDPTFHSLEYMAGGYGYWVKMNSGTGGGMLRLSGPKLPETATLTLHSSWNLIGTTLRQGYYDTQNPPPDAETYTRGTSWTKVSGSVVEQFFNPLSGNFTYLKGAAPGGLAAVFDPSIPSQFATLRHLEPGAGYEIRMSQPATFAYKTNPAAPPREPGTLDINAPTFATNRSAFIYGYAYWDGKPAASGSMILVHTQDGKLIGKGMVDSQGRFGAIAIYGDDLTTPEKDGADEGEWLVLSLNELPLPNPVRWEENAMIPLELEAKPAPQRTWLGQNFPNPFNPETWIPFALDQGAPVQIRIYDIAGHLVRTLDLGYRQAGWYDTKNRAAHWDGRNTLGERVASGVYLYQLMTPSVHQTKQLVIVK